MALWPDPIHKIGEVGTYLVEIRLQDIGINLAIWIIDMIAGENISSGKATMVVFILGQLTG